MKPGSHVLEFGLSFPTLTWRFTPFLQDKNWCVYSTFDKQPFATAFVAIIPQKVRNYTKQAVKKQKKRGLFKSWWWRLFYLFAGLPENCHPGTDKNDREGPTPPARR